MNINNSNLNIRDDLNMIEFDMGMIWFILAAYGLTQILVYSKIFEKIRPNRDQYGLIGYMANCGMCMSFWGQFWLSLRSIWSHFGVRRARPKRVVVWFFFWLLLFLYVCVLLCVCVCIYLNIDMIACTYTYTNMHI